ncbi:MAG TPA: glycosyl hydrolase family 43, partial [Planctomycetaceae bacterium]|nr:glycosyl hydrolase family 43 [Planctomycetaceae bacterium]
FWLNGNITREGITADLEAMKRAGIGGVLIMEVDQGVPEGDVPFAGPQWRKLFQHVCSEAKRLGLKVNMNNDAGWCGSGGPWVPPELAMQRLVWTETSVEGPRRFDGRLPQPKAVAGYYRDVTVLALPTPVRSAKIIGFRRKSFHLAMHQSLAGRATWPADPAGSAIPRDRVLDLTQKMDTNGRLVWDVPEGRWTILRIGHTPTGKDNHPAPESGRGLECDKLSHRAVQTHFASFIGKLTQDVGPLAGQTFVATHIDSWEVGVQNWTPKFRDEFRRRRGYDPLPWLPVVTGRVIGSREQSERFLWDLRQTVGELLLENYAGCMRELAQKHGLRLSIEAYTTCPVNELEYAGRADEPMGEFWSWSKYRMAFSCTEMASAAHVYGRPIVGAEAFTATNEEAWQGHPGNIKKLGDWAFCEGINRFVFHRYALQPWRDRRPGMSMGPWGLHYERTQTWWEHSQAWHEYLARCQ